MHYSIISKQLQKEIRGLKHRILYQQREENDRRKERKLKEEEREKTEETESELRKWSEKDQGRIEKETNFK